MDKTIKLIPYAFCLEERLNFNRLDERIKWWKLQTLHESQRN